MAEINPILGQEYFHKKIMEIVKQKFEKVANEEIDKQCEEYRKRLEKEKSVICGKLIQAIDIFTQYDMQNDKYVIQVTFKK